jgi:hypothetical protein
MKLRTLQVGGRLVEIFGPLDQKMAPARISD